MMRVAVFLFLALAGVSHAVSPENAHQVDATGRWECDRGYVMQSRPGGCVCVPESEISRERFIMSEVPSAGDGSLQPSTSARSSAPGIFAPAPSSSGPLFIQTNQPWTVVLDQASNPSTVILSDPPASRPAKSPLFGR
jgi:hypothetical protein